MYNISTASKKKKKKKKWKVWRKRDKGLNRRFCQLDFLKKSFLSLETEFKRTNVTAICVSDK